MTATEKARLVAIEYLTNAGGPEAFTKTLTSKVSAERFDRLWRGAVALLRMKADDLLAEADSLDAVRATRNGGAADEGAQN